MITIPINVLALTRGDVKALPRGLRNNNPGNIRLGDPWVGLCTTQLDTSFCQFTEARYGIRAMAKVLRDGYFHKRGLNTVAKLIDRWAPPVENNTGAYRAAVAAVMGVQVCEQVDLDKPSTLLLLIGAIIHHENGVQPYTSQQLLDGIGLA